MPEKAIKRTRPQSPGSKGSTTLHRSPKLADLTDINAVAAAFGKMSLDSGAESAAKRTAPTGP